MNLKSALLGAAAVLALAPAAFADRGSDGHVNILYWQAPSTLNPFLSGGTKEIESASLVVEPLAGFDENGELVAKLVTEIPSLANGGVSEDLTSITWKIIPGLLWSDGTPFTSADVVFTGDYCMSPDGGCAQLSKFEGVEKVEAVDDLTVKITFKAPKTNPYLAFVGGTSPILQKAQFGDCIGAKAQECTTQNFNPIGTGPFMVTEFRTNDVIQMAANPNYRDPAKPAFATLTFKGGGEADAAARSVLETGEFDYAWNLQVDPTILAGMEAAGKGKVIRAFATQVERLEMNLTDPSPALAEGERATAAHPHPFLSDAKVRQALSMALDRGLIVETAYGPNGRPTCNLVPAPAAYASDNTGCLTQDVAGAMALLDEAGWKDTDGDGIRDKDGVKLAILYQTSTNAVRQNVQAIVKQAWNDIGIEVELKNIDASVFFGGDPGSPDTFQKFYADVEMYTNNFDGTDPEAYLAAYTCEKAPKPESQWQGENINRFCDQAYDALVAELGKTGDLAKRGEIAKQLNDMLTKNSFTVVPLVDRAKTIGVSVTLAGVKLNAWDTEMWNAADWTRLKSE